MNMSENRRKKTTHKRSPLYTGAAVLVTLTVMVILLAVPGKVSHDFEGKCNLCHVGLKDPSILTREIDHLCLSCHPGSARRSHPSNIVPAKALPDQFPLTGRKMVCVTCHFPHRVLGQPDQAPSPGRTVPGPYMLRSVKVGKVFCFSCHKGGFTDEAVDSHAIALKRAHTPVAALDFQQKQLIDDNSRECLSCHDGTISTGTHSEIRGLSWEHKKNIGISHPISVDYQSVYLRKPREYHPPEGLDPRITLINGKIGCETCHNHYSKNKKHLVMNNNGSRLCLACHNL
ncbi:MAG: hypothetical protein GY940_34850 [bacterium]|nr:hypothetical protein [bacterium]